MLKVTMGYLNSYLSILYELPGMVYSRDAWQVNVINYMERRVHKDYIQLEIVVEKDGQKGILLGKVCYFLLWVWIVSRAALIFDLRSDSSGFCLRAGFIRYSIWDSCMNIQHPCYVQKFTCILCDEDVLMYHLAVTSSYRSLFCILELKLIVPCGC